jgi:hypothetical protein
VAYFRVQSKTLQNARSGSGGIAPFIIKPWHNMKASLTHLSRNPSYLTESRNTAHASHGSDSYHSVIFG